MPSLRHAFAAGCLLAFAATSAGCASRGGSALPSVPGAARTRSAPDATSAAVLWSQTDAVKVLPGDKPLTKNGTVVASGARGESVSAQLMVSATKSSLKTR